GRPDEPGDGRDRLSGRAPRRLELPYAGLSLLAGLAEHHPPTGPAGLLGRRRPEDPRRELPAGVPGGGGVAACRGDSGSLGAATSANAAGELPLGDWGGSIAMSSDQHLDLVQLLRHADPATRRELLQRAALAVL